MIFKKYNLRWLPGFCWEVQYLELAFSCTLNPLQYLQLGTNKPDSNFIGIYSFSHHSREDLQVAGNDYITCKYDEKWGIGLILEVDTMQLDAKDQHPPGPANTFFWPLKDDVCWVPFPKYFLQYHYT